MTTTNAPASQRSRLRVLLSLLAAVMLGSWVLGPAAATQAAEPTTRDIKARIMVVVKRIIVHDDLDWGAGDISVNVRVRGGGRGGSCPRDEPDQCEGLLVNAWVREFQADDGTVKQLDRVIPTYGDTVTDPAINSALGIAIRSGQFYQLRVFGFERDEFSDDLLGDFNFNVLDDNGNVRFGTFTQRSFDSLVSIPGVPDFETAGKPGAFTMELEIRRAPLPDLRPSGITIYDLPGSAKKLACTSIQNVEAGDAGRFDVVLRIDGVEVPGGRATAGQLKSGSGGEFCSEATLPAAGQKISATVDEADEQFEFNETNNVFTRPYVTALGANAEPQAGAAASPEPTTPPATPPAAKPTAGQADLTVSAVKVNGRVPDGKDDCKDGKNDVAVVVKNAGSVKAEKFAVRLTVDGDEAGEESVDGLDAGKDREVRFDDVRLKKGQRNLAATVDSKNAVAESNEDNNDRTVAATCRAD